MLDQLRSIAPCLRLKEWGILRSQVKMLRKTGDVTALKRDLSVTAVPLVLAYGVSSKLALFGVLPYVDKRMDMTLGTKRIRRQTQGIGDGKIFALINWINPVIPSASLPSQVK